MATFSGKLDLHMHSTVSDGTDLPEELLEKVKAAGIGLFALTDHDAAKGGARIRAALKPGDPIFVQGVEFSCRDDLGKYHILGYGFDPDEQAIDALLTKSHGLRMRKVLSRIEFLKEEFGFEFPKEEIDRLFALDNPGKPHIANLMVRHGFVPTKEVGIHDFLDRMKVRNEYILPEDAISAILASGGIPVLAHPFYGSGDELILGEEMEERLKRLMDFGLKGVEAFYSGFTNKLRREMLSMAERYDLYATAGSDYHGKNKLVQLGDTGLAAGEPLPERTALFLEALGL